MNLTTKATSLLEDCSVIGETGQLQLLHNAAIPELRPHTVLVKVVAVALNPYNYKLPLYFPSPGTTRGSDFAGTIIAISPEATEERSDLSLGDLVWLLYFSGGRLITLELPPEPRPGEKRRKVVKHFFVDGHEIFGVGVPIDSPGYKRHPSLEKYEFAVKKIARASGGDG
ncbi:hypothetical protein J3E71DRAFT_238923 [Bipolaris maydis]|nr:hypothetical protein J3E71DRAFT_238923 [Bipolaris maydis]